MTVLIFRTMKVIVVEGLTEYTVLDTLFPALAGKKVKLYVAQGFSNVFASAKSFIDFGFDVLAVLDTDTNIPGNDNRDIMKRIQTSGLAGRPINIVWMDACIEDVLRRANLNMFQKNNRGIILKQAVNKNKDAILALDEFRKIEEFIEG